MESIENNFVKVGMSKGADIMRDAAEAGTSIPERMLKRLKRRDSQTGAPEGALAIMKDRMFAMLARRIRKIGSRPYRRLRFA